MFHSIFLEYKINNMDENNKIIDDFINVDL